MTNRELLRFLGLTFLIALVTEAIAVTMGVHGRGHTWLGLTMWAPAIAAFTSSRAARKRALDPLRLRGFGTFWIAFLVGWSFVGLQMILLALSRTGHWNTTMFPLSADGHGVDGVHGVAMALGVGHQSFPFFVLNLVLSVTLGSVITAIIGGVGEEIGWRGVLQPEMERRFGALRGTFVVGIIWAYWHLPANLAGYNDSKHPFLNAFLLFPIVVVAMAFAFAWLTKRSRSVWPAAIAHAANNTFSSGMMITATGWAADQIAGIVAAVLIATLLGWRLVVLARRTDVRDETSDAHETNDHIRACSPAAAQQR